MMVRRNSLFCHIQKMKEYNDTLCIETRIRCRHYVKNYDNILTGGCISWLIVQLEL